MLATVQSKLVMASLLVISFCFMLVPAGGLAIYAQDSWDGGGNANDDGNWATGTNWLSDAVPSGETATLGDVTSGGTRTVTINSTPANITQLIMNQSTAGSINRLNMTAGTLTITGGTPLVQNLSGGAIQIDMAGSAYLKFNASASFSNLGDLNLAGTGSTGVRVGTENWASVTLSNTGNIDVSGTISTIGNLNPNPAGANPGSMTLNNNAGGTVSIADNATLVLRSMTRFRAGGPRDGFVVNADGANFQIGSTVDGGSGGTLRFFHRNGGDLGPSDDEGISIQRFTNAGTLDVFGNSRLELVEDRSGNTTRGYGAGQTLTFENQSTGLVNFNATSEIGNTSHATLFSNDGIFNKSGAGVARILSADSIVHEDENNVPFSTTFGTNTNTGTINVEDLAGTLRFSQALSSTGSLIGNGTIAVDNGSIDIGSAGTVRPGQIAGDFASLTLAPATSDAAIFDDGSALQIDLALDSVTSDLLNVEGNLDLTGDNTLLLYQSVYTPGNFVIAQWSGDLIGEFTNVLLNDAPIDTELVSLEYGNVTDGQLLVTLNAANTSVPEPGSLAVFVIVGVIGFGVCSLRWRKNRSCH